MMPASFFLFLADSFSSARACLKKAFCKMCVTICGNDFQTGSNVFFIFLGISHDDVSSVWIAFETVEQARSGTTKIILYRLQ